MRKLQHQLGKLKGKFLYRTLPKIVDLLTTLSVSKASKELRNASVKRILIDNSVLGHGVTHETAWINTGKALWGDKEIDTGYAARIPVHSDDDNSEAARSIRYLPGIVNLAKRKLIVLVISPELQDEKLTQPIGRFRGYGIYDFSLLNNLELETIRDPEYSMVIAPSYFGVPSLKTQRMKRLESKTNPLYRSLVSVLGPKNSQDAWHIATAEYNNCYCFLTMDFRLIRNIRAQANNSIIKSLKTKIMSPEEFGKKFNLIPMNPRLYSYHNADCPVKPNINWPDSKRQKPRKR